jgi:hypothetical protein
MLSDSLSLSTTFTKSETGNRKGEEPTTYYSNATYGVLNPIIIQVKHTVPNSVGSGQIKHLVSLKYPLLDTVNSVPTGKSVTVNLTVAVPNDGSLDGANVAIALLELGKLMFTSASANTTFGTAVLANAF